MSDQKHSKENKQQHQCGGDSEKDTPVPMPNTEVKLLSADCSEGFPLVRVGRRRAIVVVIIMEV